MNTRKKLDEISNNRIMILDGAMGTMIQSYRLKEEDFRGKRFESVTEKLLGCNDVLCLTKPDVISDIHKKYLDAGADIIGSCSFSANAISLADYNLGHLSYEISKKSAEIASDAAKEYSTNDKPRFVAGIMGPLTKSASISPDIDDPGKRSITFDEIESSYYDNACGLLDGGADLLLLETVFDTLNAKAGITAILRIMRERSIDIPIMISAAISDSAGRLLAGQTVKAFCASVLHAIQANNTGLWSIGLNCSLGAKLLQPYIRELSKIAPLRISAHPNAGLPNESGGYDETPADMASFLSSYIDEGIVNIIGGCCGSTPDHIKEICKLAKNKAPRKIPPVQNKIYLSGLDIQEIDSKLFLVGEKGNVCGNKKLLKLVADNKLEEALKMLRDNAAEGFNAIDISMDDALLDSKPIMIKFLNLALSDPSIAKIPFVIDSSDFDILESGLKCVQGRVIANSISLKEGEAAFLKKARRIRDLGGIPMIMLFDEEGQAATEARKIEIAKRVYNLLVKNNFPSHEIIVDPNILSVATGIKEHDRYALDFINACKTIKKECPQIKISAGVSNLSYSFRGNILVRNAIHSVFLKLCYDAGLSIAIVNAASLNIYDKLEHELKKAVEDLLLYKTENAAEKLLEIAKKSSPIRKDEGVVQNDNLSPKEKIIYALIHGIDDNIESDVKKLLNEKSPLEIIEGPLMDGMRLVSEYFSRGSMFLPEVIRSARVMKKAVAILEPVMKDANKIKSAKQKIILATVKGDVHDIGKNIVGTVLGCNGFEIIDLGVMVSCESIIETAKKENASMIGLSGLVTPSLFEMECVAKSMESHNFNIPLLLGGAATSLVHSALKIAPLYSAPVIYVSDAGAAPEAARSLLSDSLKPRFLEEVENKYAEAIISHKKIDAARIMLSIEDAEKNKVVFNKTNFGIPQTEEIVLLNDYSIENIIPFIDFNSLLEKFAVHNNKEESQKLKKDFDVMLDIIKKENLIKLQGCYKFFKALSCGRDIILFSFNKEVARFSFLRNQTKKHKGGANPCLSDFILPQELSTNKTDYIGLFVLSAGCGVEDAKNKFLSKNDNYSAILISAIADCLAEAFSAAIHTKIENEYFNVKNDLGGRTSIRPAFGYPCCPDHNDKRTAFDLLNIEKNFNLSLTSSCMINPAASICGMYIMNPSAYYFSTGKIEDDQIIDWAKRKNITAAEAKKRINDL